MSEMPKEWAAIEGIGCKEYYEVSRCGKVRNSTTGRILAPNKDNHGYAQYSLRANTPRGKRTIKAHKIVAYSWLRKPESGEQINHKDGNKLNNHVENLEWVSLHENIAHAVKEGLYLSGERLSFSKIKDEDAIFIRENAGKMKIGELSKKFSISPKTVSQIVTGRTWKHLLPKTEGET